MICSRLSALINDELTLDAFPEDVEVVLLLEELVDFGADFLAEPGFELDSRLTLLLLLTVLGESERFLAAKVTGLDRLLLCFGLLVVFFMVLQQSVQYHT